MKETAQPVSYSVRLDKFSSGKKAAVDWTALSENQGDMIDPQYLPPGFVFRDPSKMKKIHYKALLEHWYERQQDGSVGTVFAFKGYWDASSDSVITVPDGQPARRKGPKGRTGKRNAAPETIAPKSKHTKATMPHKRPGPPGVHKGDKKWHSNASQSEGDEDHDEEADESEDESGEDEDSARGAQSRVPPMELPFSAKRVLKGAPVAQKKSTGAQHKKSKSKSGSKEDAGAQNRKVRLPSNGKANTIANASKSNRTNSSANGRGTTDNIESVGTKRPLPRPAYSRAAKKPEISQAPAASPVPRPVNETKVKKARYPPQPTDLRPQLERPTTRSGGKRKVDEAALGATAEPVNKRVKTGKAKKNQKTATSSGKKK